MDFRKLDLKETKDLALRILTFRIYLTPFPLARDFTYMDGS